MATTRTYRFKELSEQDQAAFGVGSMQELVAVYDAWAARNGKRPLAEGSMPTSVARTRRFLGIMRSLASKGSLQS